jgi:HlyD family secretion protein
MKFRFVFFLLAIAALGGGITLNRHFQKSEPVVTDTTTTIVKQGEFVVSVNDTGILKAKKSSMVVAPQLQWSWGQMKVNKLVNEGTHVQKGDPICWLDTADLEKNLKDSEYQLTVNESNLKNSLESLRLKKENRERALKEKKLDWDSAKLEFELEQKKYDKTKRLVAAEVLPQKDFEDEQTKFRTAALKVDQTNKEYLKALEQENSDEKVNQIDIDRAQSQKNWYQRQYDQITESISKYTLYAPAEGIVVYQKTWSGQNLEPIKEGDTIWPGNGIAFIPDLREIQVMTQVAETDLSKIKVGMPVRMKMDSISDLVLTGKIAEIGNLAMEREHSAGSGNVSTEESSGIRVFEVLVDVDGVDPRLRPGMTCKVEMILESFPSVVYVPLNAIHIEGATKYIFVKKTGKQERRIVTLGKQNDKNVIIEKGLKSGEEVILPEEES